LRGSFV
jgi:hypothetical protein